MPDDPEKLDSLIEQYLDETLGMYGFCSCGAPVYGPRRLCISCERGNDAEEV